MNITAKQADAEILTDGVIRANGNVALNASTIRARHSIFATGGDITIGGPLVVEPWGDEISVSCGVTVVCNPGAVDPMSISIVTDTYAATGGAIGGVADPSTPAGSSHDDVSSSRVSE